MAKKDENKDNKQTKKKTSGKTETKLVKERNTVRSGTDSNGSSKKKSEAKVSDGTKSKRPSKKAEAAPSKVETTGNAKDSTKHRRSKAEIEAAKRAKIERQLERQRKKDALEAKRKERADKKAAREAKALAKVEAAAAKEAQRAEDAKIQKIIDGLKIDTSKYCAAAPMTVKEKALVKKCLTSPDLVMSRCYQMHGSTEFHLLNWSENEFVISIDNTYFFYNKVKNTGINFGSVFYTWLDTDKKNPLVFTEPEISKVNIIKQEAPVIPKVVVTEEQKKAIMKKMRGRK